MTNIENLKFDSNGLIPAVVVDAVTALVLCDILTGRYGTDWLGEV